MGPSKTSQPRRSSFTDLNLRGHCSTPIVSRHSLQHLRKSRPRLALLVNVTRPQRGLMDACVTRAHGQGDYAKKTWGLPPWWMLNEWPTWYNVGSLVMASETWHVVHGVALARITFPHVSSMVTDSTSTICRLTRYGVARSEPTPPAAALGRPEAFAGLHPHDARNHAISKSDKLLMMLDMSFSPSP
ncbi:hypothetical protein VDGL01_07900 [Verticillium dahliae]